MAGLVDSCGEKILGVVVSYQGREWPRRTRVRKEEEVHENGVEHDNFEEQSGLEIGIFVKHQEIESNRKCG